MDPWSVSSNENGHFEDNLKSFEDNFNPTIRQTLPDSDQYLATLESKIVKLKSDPNVLKQLRERHEASIAQLLNYGADLNHAENLELDAPIAESQLLRTLQPQRQALTIGELAQLIHHDQLQHTLSEDEDDNISHASR